MSNFPNVFFFRDSTRQSIFISNGSFAKKNGSGEDRRRQLISGATRHAIDEIVIKVALFIKVVFATQRVSSQKPHLVNTKAIESDNYM